MTDGDNKIAIARAWHKSKEALDQAKEVEMDLRKQTSEAYFGTMTKGTQRADLSDKMELVLAVSATIEVDKDAWVRHKAQLEAQGLIGDGKLITLKPSVSATAYKYLSDADKVQFADVFVHKLSSPTLKAEVKKVKE